MERKVPFLEGEIYHVYSRGVEKRRIFQTKKDYDRFIQLLSVCNGNEHIRLPRIVKKWQGEPLPLLSGQERIVEILAFSLMPNHIHIVIREKKSGGISKFMLKLMTAYSMYFNIKYERSGPLFTRPFRSKHVDSDSYFRWLFSYVHLNPLDIIDSTWANRKTLEDRAVSFLENYAYSSLPAYLSERSEASSIVSKDALPISRGEVKTIDDIFKIFVATQDLAPLKTSVVPAEGQKTLV